MGFVAGEAGDGRGVLTKGDIGARDRMSCDGLIELVSFVEVQVKPGIHFLERNCGSPRKSECARLAIHFHEAADVASHADVLRRGVQMGWEMTGVARVAESAVALLIKRMLGGVSGHGVAGKAESRLLGEVRVM